MTLPKISIITPSYNQGNYLEETILSIVSQNYPKLEYFIFDGKSTDNSVEIIKKYDSKITYWESKKDRGQSHAINKGIEKATGEIITWINSDDILMPNALHQVAKLFSESPKNIGFIHGGSIPFDEQKEYEADFGYKDISKERLLSGMAFTQPASFIRKEFLDEFGKLDEDLNFAMDYDLFSKLCLSCDSLASKQIFSKNRLHSQSKTLQHQMGFFYEWHQVFLNRLHELNHTNSIKLIENSELILLKKTYDISKKVIPLYEADEKETLFFHLCYLLKFSYWAGEFQLSKKIKYILTQNYPKRIIFLEKEMKNIFGRLSLPNFIIFIIRKIKKFTTFSYYHFFKEKSK